MCVCVCFCVCVTSTVSDAFVCFRSVCKVCGVCVCRHFGQFADDEQRTAQIIKRTDDGELHLGDVCDIASVLPPIDPPAVLCIGLNYKKHAAEVRRSVCVCPCLSFILLFAYSLILSLVLCLSFCRL